MPIAKTGAGGFPRKAKPVDTPTIVEPTASTKDKDTNSSSMGSSNGSVGSSSGSMGSSSGSMGSSSGSMGNSSGSIGTGGSSSSSSSSAVSSSPKTSGTFPRLPAIKEKRSSVVKKTTRTTSLSEAAGDNPPTTSTTITTITITPTPQQQDATTATTNTTTTTATTTTPIPASTPAPTPTPTPAPAAAMLIRRNSLPPQQSSSSLGLSHKMAKPSFAGIGRRVSNMVRARMAFQNRRKFPSLQAEEPNHMEHIHEMPQNPRFTTFLSAEAQYAVMKGYEDMLYEKIAKTNPESRLVLKRTKTPFHKKVSIVDGQGEGSGRKNALFQGNSSSTTATPTTIPTPTPITSTMSPESDMLDLAEDGPEENQATSTSTPYPTSLRRARRSQSTLSSEGSKSMTSAAGGGAGTAGWPLHRSSSLPMLGPGLSHHRRLVLTYRLESAMDILDTLKRRNKENSLSPRVYRIPRQVDAVKDFNSWTKVWNKEFKVAHAK